MVVSFAALGGELGRRAVQQPLQGLEGRQHSGHADGGQDGDGENGR